MAQNYAICFFLILKIEFTANIFLILFVVYYIYAVVFIIFGQHDYMIQGFTPYLDILLNVHMSLYCVRVQKEEGGLVQGEEAVIDDAVQ